jgi:putative DNA primase/helicase
MLNQDYDFLDTAIESGFYEKPVDAPKTQEQIISDLAELSAFDYDKVRKGKAKELGVKVSTLDSEVNKQRFGDIDPIDTSGTQIHHAELACKLGEMLGDKIRWDDRSQNWYTKKGNVWREDRDISALEHIRPALDKLLEKRYSVSLMNAMRVFLQVDIQIKEFEESRHLLPMSNGVLNLKTKKLEEYGDRFFSWELGYKYDPLATCPTIDYFLDWVTKADAYFKKWLMAWMYAVLTGRYDLQKYLELKGFGGNGKSVFQNLLVMLVGDDNVHITSLPQLEEGRFESAAIKGKRLVIVADSDDYRGGMSTFKALSGGDPIRFEKKGKDPEKFFKYKGMAMIVTNNAIQSKDYSAGLSRRKTFIEFDRLVTEADKEKFMGVGGIESAMKLELSGLINTLLRLNDDEVTKLIRQPEGAMLNQKLANAVDTNPIIGWLDANVVYCESGGESGIGDAVKANDPERYLYPNYAEWCRGEGRQPISSRKFSEDCIGQIKSSQWGLDFTTDKFGNNKGKFLRNLRLRTIHDELIPTLITKKSDGLNDSSDGSVTDETRSSDGSDGSDGLKSSVTFAEKMEVLL